jgi:hypothetical protein
MLIRDPVNSFVGYNPRARASPETAPGVSIHALAKRPQLIRAFQPGLAERPKICRAGYRVHAEKRGF